MEQVNKQVVVFLLQPAKTVILFARIEKTRYYMKTSLKIATIYALSGIIWILLSDKLLLLIVGDKNLMEVSYIQTLKGTFYVSFTAILLFFLVNSYHHKLNEKIRSLELLNQQLEQSNSELEQYAYIASHDLQEPLRVTGSLLQRLQLKYSGQLDEKANKYIDLSIENAGRMRKFVQDLLEFSKVGNTTEIFTVVSIAELIAEIRLDLEKIITENAAEIRLSGVSSIVAERMKLKQVLSNLISNGIKYRNLSVSPIVEIHVSETSSGWEISVTDNGIGIAPQFHQRIFELFQRLHASSENGGTGIGLAIAKKIVDKWSGNIWLESELQSGSIFYFTIPKKR